MLSHLDFLARIFAAVIFGGLIGLEREHDRKAAGFRTHILVCVGSALLATLAVASFGDTEMSSRVIAGIITGIGFIGAGSIMASKREHKVHGLTTAASIWVASGIGIAAGLGHYLFGLIVTILVVLILMVNDYSYFKR